MKEVMLPELQAAIKDVNAVLEAKLPFIGKKPALIEGVVKAIDAAQKVNDERLDKLAESTVETYNTLIGAAVAPTGEGDAPGAEGEEAIVKPPAAPKKTDEEKEAEKLAKEQAKIAKVAEKKAAKEAKKPGA